MKIQNVLTIGNDTLFADARDNNISNILAPYKNIVVAFSGGRDSQLAMELLLEYNKTWRKNIIIVHINVVTAMPGIMEYVVEYCQRRSVELKIIENDYNVLTESLRAKKWPSSIYKSCVVKAVQKPIKNYVKSMMGKTAIVGGSTLGQRRSGRDDAPKNQNGESVFLLYYFLKTEIAIKIKYIDDTYGLWPGYSMGFERTSCWCCPFQRYQYYELLREVHPT